LLEAFTISSEPTGGSDATRTRDLLRRGGVPTKETLNKFSDIHRC
jgi:hypothetical protein